MKQWMRIGPLAELLKTDYKTLHNAHYQGHRGGIRAQRVGRTVYLNREDAEKYLSEARGNETNKRRRRKKFERAGATKVTDPGPVAAPDPATTSDSQDKPTIILEPGSATVWLTKRAYQKVREVATNAGKSIMATASEAVEYYFENVGANALKRAALEKKIEELQNELKSL